jgi:hypothetical protein
MEGLLVCPVLRLLRASHQAAGEGRHSFRHRNNFGVIRRYKAARFGRGTFGRPSIFSGFFRMWHRVGQGRFLWVLRPIPRCPQLKGFTLAWVKAAISGLDDEVASVGRSNLLGLIGNVGVLSTGQGRIAFDAQEWRPSTRPSAFRRAPLAGRMRRFPRCLLSVRRRPGAERTYRVGGASSPHQLHCDHARGRDSGDPADPGVPLVVRGLQSTRRPQLGAGLRVPRRVRRLVDHGADSDAVGRHHLDPRAPIPAKASPLSDAAGGSALQRVGPPTHLWIWVALGARTDLCSPDSWLPGGRTRRPGLGALRRRLHRGWGSLDRAAGGRTPKRAEAENLVTKGE